MSQAIAQRMTPAEFLEWEERQEVKWEFDGVRPVAMNGVSVAHSIVQGNLAVSLGTRLRGTQCRAHGPSLKVEAGTSYRYPDIFVACSDLALTERIVLDPVVVFKILSPSTATTDRTTKLRKYRSLPSLKRYVMLEQDQVLATVIARTATGWSLDTLDVDGVLDMPEIGIEVPMAELYAGMDLPPIPVIEEW